MLAREEHRERAVLFHNARSPCGCQPPCRSFRHGMHVLSIWWCKDTHLEKSEAAGGGRGEELTLGRLKSNKVFPKEVAKEGLPLWVFVTLDSRSYVVSVAAKSLNRYLSPFRHVYSSSTVSGLNGRDTRACKYCQTFVGASLGGQKQHSSRHTYTAPPSEFYGVFL